MYKLSKILSLILAGISDPYKYLENSTHAGKYFFNKGIIKRSLEGLGITVTACLGIKLVYWMIKNTIKFFPRTNILARYGQGSWAVVTGANNPLSQAFSIQLATAGFHLVLVDKNLEELQPLANQLKTLNPKIQTKIIVTDFAQSLNDGYYHQIYGQIENLDISILVNNVNIEVVGEFGETQDPAIKNMILLNTIPIVIMTRMLIKKLKERTINNKTPKKSAIINVSSNSANNITSNMACFSATKAFVDFFSRGLAVEYPNLDIISLRPPVSKSHNEVFEGLESSMNCAKACLNQLGKTSYTSGHLGYELRNWWANLAINNFFSSSSSLDHIETTIQFKKDDVI